MSLILGYHPNYRPKMSKTQITQLSFQVETATFRLIVMNTSHLSEPPTIAHR